MAQGNGAYNGGNTTGFVSPAGDSLESRLDLSEILDLARPSRYPVRVSGNALASRGILSGDILIADAAFPLLMVRSPWSCFKALCWLASSPIVVANGGFNQAAPMFTPWP